MVNFVKGSGGVPTSFVQDCSSKAHSCCNSFVFQDSTINKSSSTKYLGLIIDDKLSWEEHTKDLCNSLVKYTGIFYQLKGLLPKKTALHIYYAFVFSKLRYAVEIYGTAKASILRPVQVLQNKLLKLLTGKPRHHPTKLLYHEYNLFMLCDIHFYCMCQIIYRYCNNMLPNSISSAIFPLCNSVHNRPTSVSTRNKDLFIVSHHNTPHGRLLLNNYCYRLWQDIPPDVKLSKSLNIFQNRLKHYIRNK
ncbi:RNA-directed DNA polymerase from mobile element jockey [Holothuria leucospilota]|uniref:RNA-directed DNA polymerase from mobile element jockey n=1 Tax=Holothuria leucospilota TaxID=206669 RepID=A0A9Q0YPQ1_HOLLE|nr:RNA-directed DNA polymerase from mobile element jockey [Holothuria leucospilota]